MHERTDIQGTLKREAVAVHDVQCHCASPQVPVGASNDTACQRCVAALLHLAASVLLRADLSFRATSYRLLPNHPPTYHRS